MLGARRWLLSVAAAAAIGHAACTDPPDKEMQQAQGAIDAARAAGADQYAREEFTAAEDALKRARDAVDQRDYRQALNDALDARERAQTAAKDTVNKKATARADADKAIAEAAAALADAHAKIKSAEGSRATSKAAAGAARAVDQHDAQVQEARAAFDRGDYLAAIDKAHAATASLRAVVKDRETAPVPAGRRRR